MPIKGVALMKRNRYSSYIKEKSCQIAEVILTHMQGITNKTLILQHLCEQNITFGVNKVSYRISQTKIPCVFLHLAETDTQRKDYEEPGITRCQFANDIISGNHLYIYLSFSQEYVPLWIK